MGTPYHEFAFCGVGLKLDVDFCFLIDECWQLIEDGFENSLALYAFYTASRKRSDKGFWFKCNPFALEHVWYRVERLARPPKSFFLED